MRDTDPLNNLKRKFYKNSNKPLGNNTLKNNDFYSKRRETTINQLNSDLKQKGYLTKNLEEELKENFSQNISEENSMLKSDVDLKEYEDVVEVDNNEYGATVAADYEIA